MSRLPVRRALAALWVLAVAAMTTPAPIQPAPGWLDGSWLVGLDLAARQHLSVGSRLLFTYGPYGFLDNTIPFFTRQWLEAVALTLTVHVALVLCVALLLRRLGAGWPLWVLATAVLVLGLHTITTLDVEGGLLAAVSGMLALTATTRRGAAPAAVVSGAVLALVLLVKATGLVVVAGALPVLVVSALVTGRREVAAWLGGAFALTFALLWAAAGLGAADLGVYLHSSLETASGYAAAQEYGGVTVALIAGALVLLTVAVAALEALLRRRGVVATWLLLALVLLAAVFKDAFVRSGPDRDAVYFAEVGLLAVLALAVIGTGRLLPRRGRAPLSAAALLAATLVGLGWGASSTPALGDQTHRLADWGTVARAVVDPAARRDVESVPRASATREYAPVIAAAQLPPGARVDFFGSDVGFFYVDDRVAWTPRRVLQSYQAYTPWLEQQDAAFFAGPDAPQYLLVRNAAIDGRYPLFEEPAMLQAVLRRYRLVRVLTGDTVLLQRAATAVTDQRPEGRACAAFGQPIAVPQVAGRSVFGRVDMGYSLTGRALDLALKPAEVHVVLDTAQGAADYRFVWQTAGDGLYLSTLATDSRSLAAVFAHLTDQPVTRLTVTGNAPWQWRSPVCVDFYSVGFSPT